MERERIGRQSDVLADLACGKSLRASGDEQAQHREAGLVRKRIEGENRIKRSHI
jgi:hypothetical protein